MSAQEVVALAVVALAAGYAAWKVFKGDDGEEDCGGCGKKGAGQ